MPELPEVETIVRALKNGGRGGDSIVGLTVRQAELLWRGSLALPDPELFLHMLAGSKVNQVSRRGKYLCLDMDEHFLFIHLRMSGDLRVESVLDEQGLERPWLTHDRLGLVFNEGVRMVFNDPRKFGRVWLAGNPEQVVGGLGPEPFGEHFTAEVFYTRLHSCRRQIKPLLLDQHFVAGLGNIYTDEALFQARIHPQTLSNHIAPVQAASLWTAIRNVLSEGIRRNGASFDWVYRGGEFQNNFEVYQRTGQPCSVCGAEIQRMVVGQRGTHYCPICQPKPTNVTEL